MKLNHKYAFCILLTACLLLMSCAVAETITFTGTVAASETYELYAPIGGTVARVAGEVGQKVAAENVLVSLSTNKVYAEEAGVVTGVFGQVGDSAETVAQKYGAVVYIEGESVYSISASTENAYNSTETKFVHVGESVYLSCYTDGKHTGQGIITAIEGTSYTVKVLSGEFLIGETVNIFRGDGAVSANRIGRGTLNRVSPTAVSGSGSIVAYAVEAGDTVQRGDVLFETLEGSFDGLYMSGSDIPAGVDGTISSINAQQGGSLQKGGVVAVIYPESAMRIEAQVEEANLASVAVGDPVSVELIWNQDEEITYPGTVSMISAIANSGDSMDGDSVTYDVYIDFTPDENTRYGMSAVVTTLDAQEDEADEEPEQEAEPEAEEERQSEAEEAPAEGKGFDRAGKRGTNPDGTPDFDPENMPESPRGEMSEDGVTMDEQTVDAQG